MGDGVSSSLTTVTDTSDAPHLTIRSSLNSSTNDVRKRVDSFATYVRISSCYHIMLTRSFLVDGVVGALSPRWEIVLLSLQLRRVSKLFLQILV